MTEHIAKELEEHAPFTIFGALTGIIMMVLFRDVSTDTAYNIFYVLHPMHVVLSAIVTVSMYKR